MNKGQMPAEMSGVASPIKNESSTSPLKNISPVKSVHEDDMAGEELK